MMNRAAGIGSLMRAGPAPGRAGLSHLARGEAVIPNAAMNADPSLRQRAMMAMASRGRNPSQFTVGQRNLRNPSTGMPMFADLVYVDGQYVDASTGQPASFSGGSYADTGYVAPEPGTSKYYPGLPTADTGYEAPTGDKFYPAPTPTQDPSGGKYYPGLSTGATEPPPTYAPPSSPEAPPPSLDFSAFTAPQTYEQWQQTRNPSGKNVPNTLFGQTQTAGGNAGFSTGGMEMPNVLAGQMPVAGASWGTPGTALGFGRENTANDPSILRSGYNDLSLSPSIYSAAFGANGLMGQQSGIAFSGQNPMTGGQNGQQNQYGTPYGAFNTAFRY
jgi:hypothetical protein